MNKQTRTGWRLVATLAALAVLAGCETTKLDEPTAAPVETRGATAGGAGAAGAGGASVTLPGQGGAGGGDAMAAPSQRIVYFDFDSYVIRDEFKGMLDGHARVLMANRGKRMAVEGHADERGSREYNLALGQKRAEAVVRSLQLLGVGDQQLEAVSFGEERPAVQGSDEAAWAKNRRAELKDR
jgi:peptidoglycan-associated lipoprotein